MFKRLLGRSPRGSGQTGSDRPSVERAVEPVPGAASSGPGEFVRRAFWIVLGRAPSESESETFADRLSAGGESGVLQELLASPEFHLIFCGWRDDVGIGKDPAVHEAGLRSLGPDNEFVRHAYEYVLGRSADEAGLGHYTSALAAGESRRQVVRVLVVSDEFEDRYKAIASRDGGGYVPRDVQLCELANPAKWDNPDWIKLMRSLVSVPHHKLAMHRKSYEWTQLLFGLQRLGKVGDETSVLSVGAGHECVLYWLANHAGRVVATDLYEGRWQSAGAMEGDQRVVEQPEEFAPFPYRRDRLTFLKMDGRKLDFPDASFDVVYSLSSIEHFGGFEGARAAVREMARVLTRGGVLALATEYILRGPSYEEAFLPDEVHALLDCPGLSLVQPIDERVYDRYDTKPVNLRTHLHQRPHMVVQVDDTVFTSVMAFMVKD